MNTIHALDDLIADLEHSIEVDTIRLDLARQLRATYAVGDAIAKLAEPEPTSAPAKPSKPKKPKARTAPKQVADKVECPNCGGMFGRLGPHKRSCKGRPSEQQLAPVPPIDATDDARRYFVCSTCDAHAETREGLAKHTDSQHRRGLKGDEHFARMVVVA